MTTKPKHDGQTMITYQSANYCHDLVRDRYVGVSPDKKTIKMYEVDESGYTLREQVIDPKFVPGDKLAIAIERAGKIFNQVKL
jgi:hypothetical protein